MIVPTFERPAALAACVAALRALDRPDGRLEIVIVNDGGTAHDPSLERTSSADGGLAIRVLHQPNAGPAAARNTGAAEAQGECLAFTDDDCLPERRWLTALDAALRASPAALVGGRIVTAEHAGAFADASQQLVAFTASWFAGGAEGRFFTSNNLAVSRDAFLASGGFDARFRFAGEDREFTDRWSAQGRPTVAVPDAVVRHAHALSARGFVRQHFSYGRGAVGFRRVRASAGRPVRISPAFYASSLSFALRAGGGVRRALVRAGLTAVAHAAYATGLLSELLRRRSSARAD